MIEFPIPADPELIELCQDWHGGQASAMYSVASTYFIHDADTLIGLNLEIRQCRVDANDEFERIRLGKWLSTTDRLAEQLQS